MSTIRLILIRLPPLHFNLELTSSSPTPNEQFAGLCLNHNAQTTHLPFCKQQAENIILAVSIMRK